MWDLYNNFAIVLEAHATDQVLAVAQFDSS
jgi:hypothetical protein